MPDQPDQDGPADNSKTQAGPAQPTAEPAQPTPVKPAARPEQSAEDTDIDWGDRPDPDHDERYHQDRPPHWGSD
jgi:cell division protein FtsN